jgi:hypothetical protein
MTETMWHIAQTAQLSPANPCGKRCRFLHQISAAGLSTHRNRCGQRCLSAAIRLFYNVRTSLSDTLRLAHYISSDDQIACTAALAKTSDTNTQRFPSMVRVVGALA